MTEKWLLDLMGEYDFTIPKPAFDKIVAQLRDPQSVSDADGWIEHDGKTCPVAPHVSVQVRYFAEGQQHFQPDCFTASGLCAREYCWNWTDAPKCDGDIVAYKVLE